MGIDLSISWGQKAENKAPRRKRKNRSTSQIDLQHLFRAKAEIQNWRMALNAWEDPVNPDRTEMMRLYQEVENDDQVETKFKTIVNKILSAAFEIVNSEGEVDDVKTALFDAEWFDEFIRLFLSAEMQGFTIIEFGSLRGHKYVKDEIEIVPREYTCPERNGIRRGLYQTEDLIPIDHRQLKDNFILVGNRKEKGAFNVIAPLYIYKKNAWAYWSNYQGKFGIPPLVAHTDTENEKDVADLVDFLTNMSSSSFAVMDLDDKVEALKGVSSDVHQTYSALIDRADAAISKIMEGQTMTSDGGSSRSQGEVHERTAGDWHLSRLKSLKRIVNDQMIPKMIRDGFPITESDVFRFKEIKDLEKFAALAWRLKLGGYKIDKDWLEESLGFKLVEVVSNNENVEGSELNEDPEKGLTQEEKEEIENLYREVISV